jgi:alkylation response protein AidB-like acyl-CoA dehydrogenase
MLQGIIQEFGRAKIIPYQKQWDEAQALPHHLFEQLGELGIMGSLVPKKHGGTGLTLPQYMKVIEELARLDAAVALSVLAHNSLCIGHILDYGSKVQQQVLLSRLTSGEWIGAWALTEPEAGSDVRNLKTTARKVGGGWVLHGRKNFITNGPISKLVVVIAKTSLGHNKDSMSAFIVEKNSVGVHVGHKDDKMGMRASETAELIFEDCYVPSENVLGEIGQGWPQVMYVLEGGRIAMAALGLGIAKGAFAIALKHAQKRCQFKQPIIHFQGVSFQLSELATQIEAAQALTRSAIAEKVRNKTAPKLVSMAKLLTSELAVKATDIAMQTLGGYGYMKNTPLEKYYRDAKLCTIGEGTSEIQKAIIIKELLAETTWC